MILALQIVGGFLGLLIGGELLVRGASAIAVRLGISPLVVGVVIVGFGTSVPELVTCIRAALTGAPGIAIGNIVGSNIANILLILGAAALMRPFVTSREAVERDGSIVIATDIAVDAATLQAMLAASVAKSFNKVTVDSDTSTSDTVLAFSVPTSGILLAKEESSRFAAALDGLALDLAHQIVKDGEGCTKFVTIHVRGAESDASAGRIARSIADSPLVKTALAGEDANWGRIVMAVGKAGEPADRDRLAISFGDIRVAVNGERDPGYSEAAASAVMKRPEIAVTVDLGIGSGADTVYTCDLTKAYVAINGDYRT